MRRTSLLLAALTLTACGREANTGEFYTLWDLDGARAGTYGFAPGRVLYESEDSTLTLPQHLLIGPDGRTWYRYIGYLETNARQRLLYDFASGARAPNVREWP